MIDRRTFLAGTGAVLLAAPLAAEAQQTGKVPRIGILRGTAAATGDNVAAFRQGLRDLGYVDGQNIVIEERHWRSDEELRRFAAELVHAKVDVVFAAGTQSAEGARDSIATIPVVFVTFADPVRAGFVANLARPSRNLTGLTMIGTEIIGKRLGLFKEALPKLSRVAVLWNPANATSGDQLRETESAARSLRISVDAHGVRTSQEIDAAFAAMKRGRVNGVFLLGDAMFFGERTRIAALAAKSRLPVMFQWRAYVDAGGLMSYGANFEDLYRQAAGYVDKILKGAKPADLPIEQPTKFELVINLKTAKALGLTIPQSLLGRADQIIE